MKRACFVCLYLFLTATLFAQSNPVPPINQTKKVVSPVSAPLSPSGRVRTPASQTNTAKTSGLNFAPVVTYGSGGYDAISVAVADVNGDGKPDLLVTNLCPINDGCANGSVGVLLGNGDGTFQPAVTYGSGGYGDPISLAVADVNGDGKLDLVVGNCGSNQSECLGGTGTVGVLLGNGDGTVQPVVTYGSGGYEANSVAVADVNGDGKPDLLVTNLCASSNSCYTSDDTVGVLLGNGDGTFQAVVTYGSGGYSTDSVAVADVNGDGKLDVLVTNRYADVVCCGSSVGVLLGNGDGTFQTAVTYGSGSYLAQSVVVADVNGDGKLDLLVTNLNASDEVEGNGTVGVLLGNGDGTFQTAVTYALGGYIAESVAVADVNGDGKPDLVVANHWFHGYLAKATTVGVLLGNGDGTFQAVVTYGSGGFVANSVAVADVNGDGKPDIVVANQCVSITNCNNGTVGVLINTSKAPTTTTLLSSVNPSVFGERVTFTATVSSLADTPTGKVKFLNGSTVLAMVTLTSGSAKYTTSKLPLGSNSITAVYSGDSNYKGSTSSPLNQIVLVATTTSLISWPNPSTYGQAVTFTAAVTSRAGVPRNGEIVSFMQGKVVLGTGTLNDGTAAFTTSTLKVGTTMVTAVYGGDSNFAPSTSDAVKQVVLGWQ